MIVDVLYLAKNRLEFTKFTWEMLKNNTDWNLVQHFHVYDDGSEDGTREFLEGEIDDHPALRKKFHKTSHNSVAAVMLDYLSYATCDAFAKIDNDIVVPSGWLPIMIETLENSDFELLGMEGGRMGQPGENPIYDIEEGSHIGGVGLMLRRPFQLNPPIQPKGTFFGFTEWQKVYRPKRGWIRPDLMVSSLDLVPASPWVELTNEYIKKEWNRDWGKYDSRFTGVYWGWYTDPSTVTTEFDGT